VTTFQRKTRLVSFRLSEEEYEWLRHVAAAHGVRSISDMARSAVRKALFGGLESQEVTEPSSNMGQALTKLTTSMEDLARRMDEIVRRLDQQVFQPPHEGRPGPQ
jgi:hypothetical protein